MKNKDILYLINKEIREGDKDIEQINSILWLNGWYF